MLAGDDARHAPRLISLRTFCTSGVGGGDLSIVPSSVATIPVFDSVPPVLLFMRSSGLFIRAIMSSAPKPAMVIKWRGRGGYSARREEELDVADRAEHLKIFVRAKLSSLPRDARAKPQKPSCLLFCQNSECPAPPENKSTNPFDDSHFSFNAFATALATSHPTHADNNARPAGSRRPSA